MQGRNKLYGVELDSISGRIAKQLYQNAKPQPYDTPTKLGIKWQMDVKYVPAACYSGSIPQKFYQYTVIDEASRERFIYPYMEQSSYSTVLVLYQYHLPLQRRLRM